MANDIVILKAKSVMHSKLNQIPILNGQLIFVRDKNCIAVDLNNERSVYEEIQVLDSDTQRESIIQPLQKFYYIRDTCVLWRYDDRWIKITSPPIQQIFESETIYEFPTVGSQYCIYIVTSENATYRWSSNQNKYFCIGRDYKEIGCIDGNF